MITKCPHCGKKYKAQESWKGRRTKCTKCDQVFHIEEYIDGPGVAEGTDSAMKPVIDTCSKCGRAIGHLEQTHVFNGEVFCRECDALLRGGRTPAEAEPEEKEKLEYMTKIATYLVLKKGTRPGAIGAIIFGILGLSGGLALIAENPINGILILSFDSM